MILDRPPLERYVRVTVEAEGYTIEPAVEYREGDRFDDDARFLTDLAHRAATAFAPLDPMSLAKAIGAEIAVTTDRAYFVEVWQDGRAGFAQVFQPFGVPRNQP